MLFTLFTLFTLFSRRRLRSLFPGFPTVSQLSLRKLTPFSSPPKGTVSPKRAKHDRLNHLEPDYSPLSTRQALAITPTTPLNHSGVLGDTRAAEQTVMISTDVFVDKDSQSLELAVCG